MCVSIIQHSTRIQKTVSNDSIKEIRIFKNPGMDWWMNHWRKHVLEHVQSYAAQTSLYNWTNAQAGQSVCSAHIHLLASQIKRKCVAHTLTRWCKGKLRERYRYVFHNTAAQLYKVNAFNIVCSTMLYPSKGIKLPFIYLFPIVLSAGCIIVLLK